MARNKRNQASRNFLGFGLTTPYTFTLDSRWHSLFGNREFALIDWDKRLQIGRGQDMAKTLQRLVATSSDPVQRYALARLKETMLSGGRMRDFKAALGVYAQTPYFWLCCKKSEFVRSQ